MPREKEPNFLPRLLHKLMETKTQHHLFFLGYFFPLHYTHSTQGCAHKENALDISPREQRNYKSLEKHANVITLLVTPNPTITATFL